MHRRWLIAAAGLVSSAVFLALAAGRVDWQRFLEAMEAAALWPWLPLAVASYVAGQVVRGWRCRLLVSREATLTLADGTHVVVLGYAVNNILPARLGELARAGMLAERSGLPYVQSLTVTFLERVLDGLVLLGLLTLAAVAMPLEGWMVRSVGVAAAVFGVAAVAVLLAVTAPVLILSLTSRSAIRIAPRLHDRLLRLASSVVNGVAYLRRPRDTLVIGLASIGVWVLEAGMFLALLPAFGLPARPATAVLVMTVTNLGILVPSSPGFVGPFHYFCMQALVVTGAPAELALSYAVVVHLAFYVPITLWGVGVIVGYGLTLSRTLALARAALSIEVDRGAPADLEAALLDLSPAPGGLSPDTTGDRPSRFLLDLVEALVPPDAARHDEGATARVAEFVQGQTAALPRRLRLLFAIGMLGFRAVTRLRYLRGFSGLPPARRRRWVERWAYGPAAPARQLLRSVRTTALLAYFELPGSMPAPPAPAPDPSLQPVVDRTRGH